MMSGGPRARVLLVAGAFPPDVCGVGDYTGRLMAAAPADWDLFVERDWSYRAAPGLIRRILARRAEAVVIQYPTQGYGWSLVPHLLALVGWLTRRYRPILALHEFSSLSRPSRMALALTSRVAAQVIFTTEAERDRARAFFGFSKRVPTAVIGIISNILPAADPPHFDARSIDIAYFGHIRPTKGIEDFLDVIAEIRAGDPHVRIAMIGEVPTGYEDYGAMVAARCAAIGVTQILGLDDERAARQLTDVRFLYLPFRDGVSARRGTVLAGLNNGAVVVTRIGSATPAALRPAVIPCSGSVEDVATLRTALMMSAETVAPLQRAGLDYIATALPRDWAHVSALYDSAIGRVLR